MPRRALIDHRPWLLASLAAALAYFVLSDARIGDPQLMLLKGAGVGLLTGYALRRHGSTDARLIAAVMAISALGDMGIGFSFTLGGAAFFAAHLVAIVLYARNRRANPAPSQVATGGALLLGTPLLAWLLSGDPVVTLYATGLGAMAASAWNSRFSRYQVGVGAVLFVISDLLIFARQAGRIDPAITEWLIWPTYYLGQLLIVTGVVQRLRKERPAAPPA